MQVVKFIAVLGLGLALSACSSNKALDMLGMGKSDVTPQANSAVQGNNLAMPPDLQLRPPGATTEAYVPNPGDPATDLDGTLSSAPPATTAVASARPDPAQDIYAQYGISRTKPDGTAKTQQELYEELKVAVRKKKKQENPNYGTVFNIGSVFSDN
jgi:hypothetical protein